MNIHTNEAGYATKEHILNSGFTIYDTFNGSDMGQITFELPQYTNGVIDIDGGYWNYEIKDKDGNQLWSGWWNSNDEFDETISVITKKRGDNQSPPNLIMKT